MRLPVLLLTLCSLALAEPIECDFLDYRRSDDLQAEAIDGDIVVRWRGGPVMWVRGTFGMVPVGATRMRARFGLAAGEPVIRELSMADSSGEWASAIRDARPGFAVGEWTRQTADQSRDPVRYGRPESVEISHSEATFSLRYCRIRGGFNNLEVSLNELTVGAFRGSLRFSVRHGSDELWQEAVVSPSKPLVGFAYRAGLVGLERSDFTAVRWINATGSGPDHRILGGKSDAHASDALYGELGELASQRGVSLSLILPTRASPPALRNVTTGEGTWFLRRPDGRFNVGVQAHQSLEAYGLGEERSDVPTGGPNRPRRDEMSEQPLVKENWPYRMGIIYRLDRHRTPPARFRSSSP